MKLRGKQETSQLKEVVSGPEFPLPSFLILPLEKVNPSDQPLLMCFSFLTSLNDLANCARVCKAWRRCSYNSESWM